MTEPKSIDDLNPGEDYYTDMFDLLGTEDPSWSPKKVKELLRGMIDYGIIYHWDEARLYRFLLTKGLLNLDNRHRDFFRNIIRASRDKVGKQIIEEYAETEDQYPPDLEPYGKLQATEAQVEEQEIKAGSQDEIAGLIQKIDPLDDDHVHNVQQILKDTEFLTSINIDEEAMKFYVNYEINELWKAAFKNEPATLNQLKNEGKTGNKYRDEVVATFLKEYDGTKKLKVPNEILKHYSPFLMQKYVAYKMLTTKFYGNFSGTGSGKTLSAIMAARTIDSKMTLIICPNDVVDHWGKNILELYADDPKMQLVKKKAIFKEKYDSTKNKYLILNWDTIQQKHLKLKMLNFLKQKIDFVILDEIHFSKVTHEQSISERRKNLNAFLKVARKKNRKLRMLGLSATPVVNNLKEGKSLIQLLSSLEFHDLDTRPTVPNAVMLYEKLTNVSIRQIPQYNISVDRQYVEVETEKPPGQRLKILHKYPLAIEQFLTDARIPEIVKRIDGPTIIYTEYVGTAFGAKQPTILNKIADAVEKAGYTFDFYTGENKSGLDNFLERKIQVLIASRPISTGIDGLQTVCTNLIFNTLPWTHALYQQIIGRIVRTGQGKNKVSIHHIKATIGGYPYDETKLDRLKFKRTLADCAVDGLLPEKNLVNPQQATRYALKWLERLERGEFSCVTRREIEAPLTIEEEKKYKRELTDFQEFNRLLDVSRSETTYKRWKKDPTEFKIYHKKYAEERKKWNVIPVEVIIKKIKQLSERLLIGDFGCGEAFLYKAIGNRVKNFDMVSVGPEVDPCDMKDVSEYVDPEGLDVAVFCLSLMGTNWRDYIKEAHRCLAKEGKMFVVVTTDSLKRPRLQNLIEFIKETGFVIEIERQREQFTFIDAEKV